MLPSEPTRQAQCIMLYKGGKKKNYALTIFSLFTGSVLQGYSQVGGRSEDLGRTQRFLEDAFQSGAASCLICIASVKRNDPVRYNFSSNLMSPVVKVLNSCKIGYINAFHIFQVYRDYGSSQSVHQGVIVLC